MVLNNLHYSSTEITDFRNFMLCKTSDEKINAAPLLSYEKPKGQSIILLNTRTFIK